MEDFESWDLSESFFLLERCDGSWSWRSRLPINESKNCFPGRLNSWKGTAVFSTLIFCSENTFFFLFFLWFPSQNQEEIRLRKLQLFHRKPTPCWISWPLNQEATPRKQKTPILPSICDWSNLLLNICHEISTLLPGVGFKFFFSPRLGELDPTWLKKNQMSWNKALTSHTFGSWEHCPAFFLSCFCFASEA